MTETTKRPDCEFCEGTGLIEKTETYRIDPSTPEITEGTGIFERCFNCNAPDDYDNNLE